MGLFSLRTTPPCFGRDQTAHTAAHRTVHSWAQPSKLSALLSRAISVVPIHPESMEFEDCICPCGLPHFFPVLPTWQHDAALRTRLMSEIGLAEQLLAPLLAHGISQRRLDDRTAHFDLLVRSQERGAKKTAAEWAQLLLVPAGWVAPAPADFPSGEMTAPVFVDSIIKLGALQQSTSEGYEPPPGPLPRTCGWCRQPCTSQCLCGQAFCSRPCMESAWASHREACKTLFEQDYGTAALVTLMEMKDRLSADEWQMAIGPAGTSAPAQDLSTAGLRGILNDPSTAPEARAFARMRLGDQSDQRLAAPGGTVTKVDAQSPHFESYEAARAENPIHHGAQACWLKVMEYESLTAGSPEEAARGSKEDLLGWAAGCFVIDDTAAMLIQDGRGNLLGLDKLQKVVNEVIGSRRSLLRQGKGSTVADAYLVKNSLLNALGKTRQALRQTTFVTKELQQWLRHPARTFFTHSCNEAATGDVTSAFKSASKARDMATKEGDYGLAWEIGWAIARCTVALSKQAVAVAEFRRFIDVFDDPARREQLGGRQLDPKMAAEVCSAEFILASTLMSGDRQEIVEGRQRYISACRREETLHPKARQNMDPTVRRAPAAVA